MKMYILTGVVVAFAVIFAAECTLNEKSREFREKGGEIYLPEFVDAC